MKYEYNDYITSSVYNINGFIKKYIKNNDIDENYISDINNIQKIINITHLYILISSLFAYTIFIPIISYFVAKYIKNRKIENIIKNYDEKTKNKLKNFSKDYEIFRNKMNLKQWISIFILIIIIISLYLFKNY